MDNDFKDFHQECHLVFLQPVECAPLVVSVRKPIPSIMPAFSGSYARFNDKFQMVLGLLLFRGIELQLRTLQKSNYKIRVTQYLPV